MPTGTTMDRKRLDGIMDMVEEMAAHEREVVEESITGTPIGQEQVDDETFAAWFELKLQESPPRPLIFPNDDELQVRVVSPWAAALVLEDEDGKAIVQGGKAIVERYNRIRGEG